MPTRPKPPRAADAAAPRSARPRNVRLPAGVTVPADLDPLARLRCAAWHLMGQGRWAEAAKLAARATRLQATKPDPKPP